MEALYLTLAVLRAAEELVEDGAIEGGTDRARVGKDGPHPFAYVYRFPVHSGILESNGVCQMQAVRGRKRKREGGREAQHAASNE